MWGDDHALTTVLLDGQQHLVRQNLHDFFEQQGNNFLDCYLWIDQICINQANVSERSSQVQVMHRIFSRAHEVLVWLGTDPDEGQSFRTLGRLLHDQDSPYQDAGQYQLRHDFAKYAGLSAAEVGALNTLCANPYWLRHWVIQELLLASHIAVLYGRATLPWADLSPLIFYAIKETVTGDGDAALSQLQQLFHSRDFKEEYRQLNLMRTLDLCRRSKCTDARDKVYGIQSLILPQLLVVVDYRKTTEEVLLDMALALWPHYTTGSNDAVWGFIVDLKNLAATMGVGTKEDTRTFGLALEEYRRELTKAEITKGMEDDDDLRELRAIVQSLFILRLGIE